MSKTIIVFGLVMIMLAFNVFGELEYVNTLFPTESFEGTGAPTGYSPSTESPPNYDYTTNPFSGTQSALFGSGSYDMSSNAVDISGTDYARVSAWVRSSATNVYKYLYWYNTSTTATTINYLADNGNFWVSNPNVGDSGVAYSANTWYEYRLYINKTSGSCINEFLDTSGTILASGVDTSCTFNNEVKYNMWNPSGYSQLDNISFYNGTEVLVDTTPPILSAFNCTSCNPPNGDAITPYTSSDTTPTFSFTSDETANCRVSNLNSNFTIMNSSRDCATTGTTSHICSLNSIDAMTSFPTDYVYIACEDSLNNENATSSTPDGLEMDYTALVTTVNNRGFATQYVEVLSKTSVQETLNLTVELFNPNTYDFNSVTVTPPSGFGAGATISVASNSSNRTSFTNTTVRGTNDQSFYTIGGSVLTGNISMTTNPVRRYIPVSNQTWLYLNVVNECRATIDSEGNLSIIKS